MAPANLEGRSIVCISSIDWDFLWQGHQEIMLRFAARGARIVFVENSGVRTIRPSDAGRVLHRLSRWSRQRMGHKPANGVTIISPLLLPFTRSRLARALNQNVLIPRLGRAVRDASGDDPIVFTFLPTPTAMRLIHEIVSPRSVLVYYCIAEFSELSDLGADLQRSEDELVRRSDLIFVQSETFARRFQQRNPRIHSFQFGVNLERFRSDEIPAAPTDIAQLAKPLIGYSGGLHRHLDLGLVAEVARSLKQGSIVLVGPAQLPDEQLRQVTDLPNVFHLGPKPFAELPAYVGHFDVGLVPYDITAYTESVFPTKLFEYLAMGRPVVSTDLPEVRRLELPSYAVRVTRQSDEFVDAVSDFLSNDAPANAARRAALAGQRDWSAIVDRMASLILQAADEKTGERGC